MGSIFLGIPLTIFVLFVLPIWLWLHYNSRNSNQSQLDQNEIQRLAERVQHMQARIKTLEDILDAEHPDWRQS
ncbi:envelope stress response membrane protein PspB [Photorhabdus laumondii subsp. laumondii]|uniref:Phage shock protein B n=3 Tax=Photorhabdus TaxID=29487 RepID=Q7N3X8_PHOLL|nr:MULTISPECIES: envelope stress response membrane protein PspB [Photorhabdus]AWK42324.1 phage shock protein B [Photorhabdus laumondii subsp. laumondii]AXG43168.1 envelope stress response membrane protein PspB [Photorhabdus laumondii subsp. laumondii]AXG47639.1 envelope stress response membrane protein PspB [Photorhabdus laumondii subsp. laumondii]KTL62995.1 phage shock protein B [Photorhabdus laumondii subsp. laumondii]MBS9438536.1 envelope stress response membrane protein PspB [Photorhabdus 